MWNRNFTLLWQGQLVSQLGSQAFYIAMAFWVKHETGSATAMGLVMMATAIPTVVLSPLAGAFVDRHSRKAVIVGCDLINGCLTITLALVFMLWPEETGWGLVALFTTAMMVSAVTTFFRPAVSAAIPDIVPAARLNGANSLHQGSMQIATLLGMSVGGVLYRVLGAPVLFLVDGISYLISAISEMFMRIPSATSSSATASEAQPAVQGWRRTRQDIVTGFAYIWRRTGMRSLMLTAAMINFFTAPYLVLMPFFVEDTLGSTPDWYGYIVAAFSAGALLGYATAGTLNLTGRRRSRMMVGAMVIMTMLFCVMGLAPNPPAAVAILFAAGTVNGFYNISLQTLFQITTLPHMRGRVFSLLITLSQGLMPAAMGLTGVVADLLDQNIRLMFVGTGAVTLLLAVAVSLHPAFRAYLASDTPDEADGR